MFSATGHIFDGAEGVESRSHVLNARTHFRRNRGRRFPFSCFAFLDSFSANRRASGLDFLFCAPGHVFDGTEGVGSRFHVLRSRARFRRYRGRRIPFSFFARPDSFSKVLMASCPVSVFCAPRLIFGGTDSVGSHFHLLRT
jgi:hypothetical protein